MGRRLHEPEGEVVSGDRAVPEAVGDQLDVAVHCGVVGVVQPVPLAALVRRVGHRAQVAVREVVQVRDGDVTAFERGADLRHVPGRAVHCVLTVPHEGAAAGDVDRGRDAEDV